MYLACKSKSSIAATFDIIILLLLAVFVVVALGCFILFMPPNAQRNPERPKESAAGYDLQTVMKYNRPPGTASVHYPMRTPTKDGCIVLIEYRNALGVVIDTVSVKLYKDGRAQDL